jgi:hypothetical protein
MDKFKDVVLIDIGEELWRNWLHFWY